MTQLADAGADVSNDIKGGAALAYKAMGTSNKAHQASPFGTGTAKKIYEFMKKSIDNDR